MTANEAIDFLAVYGEEALKQYIKNRDIQETIDNFIDKLRDAEDMKKEQTINEELI